jgi:2-hydroxychromene-2-carboxylate isomerase
MPRQVDYYFSIQSPWAYIGHQPFRDLVSAYDLKVNHKPVVLVDLFSETGGLPLMKRHPVRQRYRMVELQRWRDKRGLTFHLQPSNWPFNARLADGVVIAAMEAGLDPDCYLRRAFAGVWEDQLNLADPATIAKLADESGLPGNWWSDRARTRSARLMSRTVRTRWRPTCSARRSMCLMARCSGDRTASICSAMR